jgi:hypothetical protein
MRTNRDEWKKRIERWQESELTAEQYASELGINAGTLKFWKYKLGRAGSVATAPAKKQRKTSSVRLPLVEVRPAIAATASGFELELNGGRRLRIPASFEADVLDRLLAVLERTT